MSKSLVKKLVEVMASVETVEKRGWNNFNQYHYATEEDILKAVRQGLAERNVFVLTSIEEKGVTNVQGKEKVKTITHVRTKHTFLDGDTDERLEVFGYGQGQDEGDKGGYKAITGAMKYFLMKNFLMPTGDDPEIESGEKPKAPVRKAAAPRPVTRPRGEAPIDDIPPPPAEYAYANPQREWKGSR